jgi:hypothetical protein
MASSSHGSGGNFDSFYKELKEVRLFYNFFFIRKKLNKKNQCDARSELSIVCSSKSKSALET